MATLKELPLLILLATLLIGVTAASVTPASKARHAVLTRNSKSHYRKQHRSKGTLLTFRRPTTDLIAKWFENVKDTLEFNHDSVGMTNPCLHIALSDNDQSVLQVSSSSRATENEAWWPAPCNKDSIDSSWRVRSYRRRIGEGEPCYDKVRDAALDWEFKSDEEKGILQVCRHSVKEMTRTTRQDSRVGFDVVHNANSGDGELTLTGEVGRHVRQIWSGPHQGRRLVTYSAAHVGGEKVRFRWPRLYAVNPVMVVYDLVDQR